MYESMVMHHITAPVIISEVVIILLSLLCCVAIIVALWASTGAGPSKSLKPESHSAFISAPRAGFMTAMNAHAADGVSKDESKKTLRATLGKNFDRREAMKVALPGAIAAALTPAAAFAAKPPQIQSMRPPKGEKTGQIKTWPRLPRPNMNLTLFRSPQVGLLVEVEAEAKAIKAS